MPPYARPTIFVPYHEVDTLTLRGLREDQPPANEVTPGALYFVTDENLTERSSGLAWESYSGAGGGGGGAPDPHAPTHDTGGSDPLTALSAGIITTGILPDGRFPPTLPAVSGVNLTNLNATQLTSGSVPDARLSANVARKDQANTFTQVNTFTAEPIVRGVNARVVLHDTGTPANTGRWRVMASGQALYLQAVTDDDGALRGTPIYLNAQGDIVVGRNIYEAGRNYPLGFWTDFTPGWGSDGNPQPTNANLQGRYCRIGNTVIVNILCGFGSATTYGNGAWYWTIPIAARATGAGPVGSVYYLDAGTIHGIASVKLGTATVVRCYNQGNPASGFQQGFPHTWADNDYLQFQLMYEAQ